MTKYNIVHPDEEPEARRGRLDRLLANVVNFLLEGGENDAATLVLMCSLDMGEEGSMDEWGDWITYETGPHLTGPRAAYDILHNPSHPIAIQAVAAFRAVDESYTSYTVSAQKVDTLTPDWRNELKEIAAGRGVHNQAPDIEHREIVQWKNLRFRSQSEIRIAAALDAAGALFLPNCRARLGGQDERRNMEADFLVCHNGKWGILEVDGPFHPRASEDHERDRLFQEHGIRVTQRFDWKECYNNAPRVVQQFLTLLARNG